MTRNENALKDVAKDVIEKDVLTVAEAATRLGTTILHLRRLLARPDMVRCSHMEDIETKRGTRTSTVVLFRTKCPESRSLGGKWRLKHSGTETDTPENVLGNRDTSTIVFCVLESPII